MSKLVDAFYSLGSNINKIRGKLQDQDTQEGVVSEKLPELTVALDNDAILSLTEKWEKDWTESEVCAEWIKQGDDNENYWKGKQHDLPKGSNERPLMDNVLFESLETYLPQVTRRNPDPMVMLSRKEEQTPENLAFASELQKELGEIADEVILRLKLKKTARHWAVYLLGVIKMGWDLDKDIPTVKVVRPRKCILDPEATIDEDGNYTGEFIGEHRKLPASVLIDMITNIGGEKGAVEKIKELSKDKNGKESGATEIGFIEWQTDQYLCWTLKNQQVLLKKKNPNWNYDSEQEAPYGEDGQPQLDETGAPLMQKVPGVNHFASPKKPYLFLTVFNLGKKPVDETSLMGQNLAGQDLVNKRLKQIDKNADSQNEGMVVSLERSGLTKPQAQGITTALRKGGTVVIPSGTPGEAVQRMSATPLPSDVFNQLVDTRIRMRDIFGTSGSSSAGLNQEKTVRGKMQNRVLDTDRIGGGLSEYLEQLADSVYNWMVQLMYVYDERYAGKPNPKVRISVKEGSLLPKDTMTLANQAIELSSAGKMSLVDLYKALDYPNPEEMAANAWLEVNAPELLFPSDTRVQQVIQARQASTTEKPPSESISYKDLPPEGQVQMAAQAGIELSPEAIVMDEQIKANQEAEKRSMTLPKLQENQ